jgi:hypothetical protein
MPRLLEVLNEHIAALSEIHDAEMMPEGDLTALPEEGGSAGACGGQDVACGAQDGSASTEGGDAAAAVTATELRVASVLPAPHKLATTTDVSVGLRADPRLPMGLQHQQYQHHHHGFLSHQFFDHIDRHYLEQQQHFVIGQVAPAGHVPVMRAATAAASMGGHVMLAALPTAAVAADS